MISALGTDLAYAMCMGCPVPKTIWDSFCHRLRGPQAFEKGNKCYLDEISKGNVSLPFDLAPFNLDMRLCKSL